MFDLYGNCVAPYPVEADAQTSFFSESAECKHRSVSLTCHQMVCVFVLQMHANQLKKAQLTYVSAFQFQLKQGKGWGVGGRLVGGGGWRRGGQ